MLAIKIVNYLIRAHIKFFQKILPMEIYFSLIWYIDIKSSVGLNSTAIKIRVKIYSKNERLKQWSAAYCGSRAGLNASQTISGHKIS